MKSITSIAAALIAILPISISLPLPAIALDDLTRFDTHVDMYEQMCKMYKYRMSNESILRFGRAYYLQYGILVATKDDHPDRVQMLKRARANNMASAALEVASADDLCH